MKTKRFLLIALIVAFVLSLASFVACDGEDFYYGDNTPHKPATSDTADISGNTEQSTDSPTSADPAPQDGKVTVTFDTGASELTIAPQTIDSGATVDRPAAVREGFVLRRWLYGNEEFDFASGVTSNITLTAEWLEQTNLSTLVIELYNDAGGVYNIADVDKETYIKSKVTLANADGSFELDNVGSGFKGRGNGSWMQGNNKNGYKLKFDKKQSLFGREANKHWVILACTNFSDPTLLRNFTAYEMASEVLDGIEYVTSVEWIDVYINGDYRGVYVLCEHVRVGKGRVNIKSEYGVLDTGYLIEYDAYADGIEGVDYFSIADGAEEATQVSALLAPGGDNPDSKGDNPGGDNPGGDSKGGGDDPGGSSSKGGEGIVKYNFTMHSPDPEDYESDGKITEAQYREQVAFIRDYVKRAYTAAIVDHDFATFCELVDIDSLVDMYILHELYKNTDAGYSSFYMYKKPGGKLYFGPPWDFDATTTSARGEENDPNGIYVAGTVKEANSGSGTDNELYYELYNNVPEFKAMVIARWKQVSPQIQAYYDNLFTDEFYAENKYAIGRNFVRWGGGEVSGATTLQSNDTDVTPALAPEGNPDSKGDNPDAGNPDSKGDNPGGGDTPGGDNPGGDNPGGDSKGGGDDSKGGGGSSVEQQRAESNWVENCKILKKWFDDRIKFLNEEWK